MLDTMPEVGQVIRDVYHHIGVKGCTPISLYFDNAGGHGTDEAVLEYCTLLAEQFNVICTCTPPTPLPSHKYAGPRSVGGPAVHHNK